MDTKDVVRSQYHASLAMLRQTIERCPDETWGGVEGGAPFWHVAYHALFYTHLYMQPTEDDFVSWSNHQDESQFLDDELPWPPHDKPKDPQPYGRNDLLEYLALVDAEVDRVVPELDLGGSSGFWWLEFGKLELQLYNIRHVQQHAGELSSVIARAGVEIDWVGRGPQEPES